MRGGKAGKKEGHCYRMGYEERTTGETFKLPFSLNVHYHAGL